MILNDLSVKLTFYLNKECVWSLLSFLSWTDMSAFSSFLRTRPRRFTPCVDSLTICLVTSLVATSFRTRSSWSMIV